MRKILLIEDQLDFQLTVKSALKGKYELLIAGTTDEALRVSTKNDVDLILLDVGLPDGSGLDLFGKLKEIDRNAWVPVIFLTGRSNTEDIVAGFALGADDYVVKPFDQVQFRARIDAKIRVLEKRKLKPALIKRGKIELDCAMMKAFGVCAEGRRDLDLTPHEFRLLIYFVQNEDKVLSRDQLMGAVWGNSTHVLVRTVDRHVSSLRRKLDSAFAAIDSIHSAGYRFSAGFSMDVP